MLARAQVLSPSKEPKAETETTLRLDTSRPRFLRLASGSLELDTGGGLFTPLAHARLEAFTDGAVRYQASLPDDLQGLVERSMARRRPQLPGTPRPKRYSKAFYLEWLDRPLRVLGGLTPRAAAQDPEVSAYLPGLLDRFGKGFERAAMKEEWDVGDPSQALRRETNLTRGRRLERSRGCARNSRLRGREMAQALRGGGRVRARHSAPSRRRTLCKLSSSS